MASEHTAKAFDSDLQELTRLVAEMGGLAERMITESVDALVRRDIALGKRVVASDIEIDSLQRVIEERAVLTIARRQPMAIDLREIVGAMRVATDLERIGDLAKNRSEERRVGKECALLCRYRWSADHLKKKKKYRALLLPVLGENHTRRP